jgi:hypothetical protein
VPVTSCFHPMTISTLDLRMSIDVPELQDGSLLPTLWPVIWKLSSALIHSLHEYSFSAVGSSNTMRRKDTKLHGIALKNRSLESFEYTRKYIQSLTSYALQYFTDFSSEITRPTISTSKTSIHTAYKCYTIRGGIVVFIGQALRHFVLVRSVHLWVTSFLFRLLMESVQGEEYQRVFVIVFYPVAFVRFLKRKLLVILTVHMRCCIMNFLFVDWVACVCQ